MTTYVRPGTPAYRRLPAEIRAAYEQYMAYCKAQDAAQAHSVKVTMGVMEPVSGAAMLAINRAESQYRVTARLALAAYATWKAAEQRHPSAPRIHADYAALAPGR